MPYSRKLKFSINTNLVDKQQPYDKKYFSEGFEPIEDTIENLAQVICEEGWAFSYRFQNSRRNKQNFISADFVCVDVDGGMELAEAQNSEFVKKYCSFIYTTPSHTMEQNRFRLVFILPETITEGCEITAISRSLARRFNGDMASTDAARLFYGSRGCFYQVFERNLTREVVDQLIQDGKYVHQSDSILNNNTTTTRSMLRLDKDMVIIDCNNQELLLKDVDRNTSIYCPFHEDKNPSAFVSKNKNGHTYIHCKSCNAT